MTPYQFSQRAIAEAEEALSRGDVPRARKGFVEAAMLQEEFVQGLPPERVRTKSAFAVSVASLYYKAEEFASAEATACRFMAERWLLPDDRLSLRDILVHVWNEANLRRMGLEVVKTPLVLSLMGGRVLYGLAPLDVVDPVVKTAIAFLRRAEAYLSNLEFRPRLRTDDHGLQHGFQALWGEAAFGSYCVPLYLAEPTQLELPLDDGRAAPTAEDVVKWSLLLTEAVTHGSSQQVNELVPDDKYRNTMVRLLRELMPDGRNVREIRISGLGRIGHGPLSLQPEHKQQARDLLRQYGAGEARSRSEGGELRGVLRAVDLDRGKLKVVGEQQERVVQLSEELYDIIGPMLNRVVRARTRPVRPRSTRLVAVDIELAENDPDARRVALQGDGPLHDRPLL